MDDIDQKLLAELSADGRLPYESLAARVGIPLADVRERVDRMLSEGIISGFTLRRGDRGASAVVLVSVDTSGDTAKISKGLADLDCVHTIYEITGQHDIMVIMSADTIPAINHTIDELRRLPGVADTNTAIILRRAL